MNIFISYAKEDHKIAKKLYNDLKDAAVTPWLDSEDMLPGQNWKQGIYQAIKESSFFLTLLSSNSVSKSGFVQKEQKAALELLDEFPPDKIFIIPVRLDDCLPNDEKLKNLHWIDLFSSYKKGLNRIVHVLIPEKTRKKETFKIFSWFPKLLWINQICVIGSVIIIGSLLAVMSLNSVSLSQTNAPTVKQNDTGNNVPLSQPNAPTIKQNNTGNNNQNIGNVKGNVIINNAPIPSSGHFLSNPNGLTLIVDEPDFKKALSPEHHIGLAITGTGIELLESKPDPGNPVFSWTKIKVLDGKLAGKIGWVSTGRIQKR